MMTLAGVRTALNMGMKVCYGTSRFEVYLDQMGEIMTHDLKAGTTAYLDSDNAGQCFIKTGWND